MYVGNMNKVKWEKSHPEFFYDISYIWKNQTKQNNILCHDKNWKKQVMSKLFDSFLAVNKFHQKH